MNIKKYVNRIGFTGELIADHTTLTELFERHLYTVPFENLDVHYKRPFNLESDLVFDKIVNRSRGGFCYELNSLFNTLLLEIGFSSRIITARVFSEAGEGPEYDHMAIQLKTDKEYLVDVGFGELMMKPLKIEEGMQHDGRNFFKTERRQDDYVLSMSYDGERFEKKYSFSLKDVKVEDFMQSCLDKQIHTDSYFVKNTVCTKPTSSGRITIFNNKLIEKKDNVRSEIIIVNDDHLKKELLDKFEIKI